MAEPDYMRECVLRMVRTAEELPIITGSRHKENRSALVEDVIANVDCKVRRTKNCCHGPYCCRSFGEIH
jgi:hypothetical protein